MNIKPLLDRLRILEQRKHPNTVTFAWCNQDGSYTVHGQTMTEQQFHAWRQALPPSTTAHVFIWVHDVTRRDVEQYQAMTRTQTPEQRATYHDADTWNTIHQFNTHEYGES